MTEQEAYDKGYKQGYADRIEMERVLRVKDCISREDVKERINLFIVDGEESAEHYKFILDELMSLPPVKPTRAKGNWIDDMDLVYHVSICSNCGWRGHGDTCLIYKPKYCPNCGADMRGEEE